jgi:hypothetical protein
MTLKLRPGFLVSLSTRVEGGVSYERIDLEERTRDDGSEFKRWETRKLTIDPEEHDEAVRTRLRVRTLVKRVCAATPFGLICPAEDVPQLDEALAEADRVVAEFNAKAQHCSVHYASLRGEIAKDQAEAVASVRKEVAALVESMSRAVELGDVKSIRDLAGSAGQMERLLEERTEGRDQLSRAVNAARRVARAIVKRVERGGEDLAAVLAEAQVAPIALARMTFAAESIDAEEPEVAGEEDSLPDVNLARFADLDEGPADEAVAGGVEAPYTPPAAEHVDEAVDDADAGESLTEAQAS